jgi:hypothetical protein
VNNDGNFPFNSYWESSPNSSWISYSSPLNIAGDTTGATYDYKLIFTPDISGLVAISFASDNPSKLYINNQLKGGNPSDTAYFALDTVNFVFDAGTTYTIDFDVVNTPLDASNPTGADVEFKFLAPVPEPTTIVAGALLLLPLGASTLRGFRKSRIA